MADEAKKDVVPSQYREKYKATGGTNGDFIAVALSKVGEDGIEALASVKTENGIEPTRWNNFNPGMQRMNLANVLRGMYLKGETITILGKQYNAKHQSADFNGTVADDAKTLGKLAEFLQLQNNDRMTAALSKLFFPPAPKGPTAEQRAEAKAKKDAEKLAAKEAREKAAADKKAAAEKAKADKKAAADKAKADKAAAAQKAKDEKAAKAANTAKT